MPPRRTLFSVDDYFGLDLEEYFGARTPFSSHADDDDDRRRGRPRLRRGGEGNDDAIVDWIGLDTCVSVDDFRGTTIVARKTPGAAATSTTPPDSVAALAGRRIRQRSPRSRRHGPAHVRRHRRRRRRRAQVDMSPIAKSGVEPRGGRRDHQLRRGLMILWKFIQNGKISTKT